MLQGHNDHNKHKLQRSRSRGIFQLLIWHENELTMIIHDYTVSLFVSTKTCNHAEFLFIGSGLLDKRRSAEQEVAGSNP